MKRQLSELTRHISVYFNKTEKIILGLEVGYLLIRNLGAICLPVSKSTSMFIIAPLNMVFKA
mgnify:CR=1 FL=1